MRSLGDGEFRVTTTQHPSDVRDALEAGTVSICLLQDTLPGGSGLDLCAELSSAEATRAAPILIFSRDPGLEAAAREHGAAGFLAVPCPAEVAREAVAACLMVEAAPVAAVAILEPAPEEATVPAPETGETRILLVDDSKVVHSHVGGILKEAGYIVSHAMDGVEGLERATEDLPDLIISDIEMPNMDGFEMCRHVKEAHRTQRIPIVILSSRGASVDMDQGFDVGANDYLTKPVDDNELLSRIDHILGVIHNGVEKRERIVVAEDSRVQRNLIVQGLEDLGDRCASELPAPEGSREVGDRQTASHGCLWDRHVA
ncbi:MAG: response regulator, partial [Candidatus Poribacteria bacterium]